jgi:hypothetical protein
VSHDLALYGVLLGACLLCLDGCEGKEGANDAGIVETGVIALPEGGCLRAIDCASGAHCDCGFLNINFAARGCDAPGTCIAALPACNLSKPDSILCDTDGGCPLGGTCGADNACSTPWCSRLDASPDAPTDAPPDAILDAIAPDAGSD